MDKPNLPEKQASSWTTWEELLLACAVHRYGTQSWDSVAAQLRKRSSTLHHLTPQICKRKFHDLRRRFNHHHDSSASPIPWLDQLRQLRLDELRREVQRHDVSIVSLQLKVDKLKEVREKSDLEKSGEEQEIKVSPANILPENLAVKDVSGEGSVPNDGRSFNESNTTDPKPEVPGTGVDKSEKDARAVEPAAGAVEKSSNPGVVEDSCNGSSDSVVKEAPVAESEKVNSGESVAEGREESRSGSELSLSSKLGPEPKPSEPVEPDQEDQSPAMIQVAVMESQPLVDFLGILRSHKAATFFERRLPSQETPIYTKMIRQHIDFELVQTRLNGGWYSSCKSKFFRDILLICKNAMVFFGKRSPEYTAACELQLLVLKEMACKDRNQDPSPKQETQISSKQETLTALLLKPETESSEPLLAKSKLSIPLTACRKRSSIKARASTSSSAPDIKKEQKTASLRDVPAISWKQIEESSEEVDEELPVTKKRRKERVRSNPRNSSNKNSKGRSDANKEKNPDANANANVGSATKAMISNEISESIAETEKKSNSITSGKRQSAEKFLNRMKKSSPSNNKSEVLKIPENESKGVAEQRKNGNSKGNAQKAAEQRKNVNGKGNAQKEVAEQKKGGNGNGKGSAQKEQASRRGSGGRQAAKEQGSPSRKSLGRPSKRAAETTRAAPAKRRR